MEIYLTNYTARDSSASRRKSGVHRESMLRRDAKRDINFSRICPPSYYANYVRVTIDESKFTYR